MNLAQVVPSEFLNSEKSFSKALPEKIDTNYMLRTWTTGCYFFDRVTERWVSDGMAVSNWARKNCCH
jgi:hypothetical protein